MRIAILVPTFWAYSGPDRVAEQQAKDLARKGHEVDILTLDATMVPPEGVRLRTLGMPGKSSLQRVYRLLFPLDLAKGIRWALKLSRYDVVYCHQYPMTWLAYLGKRLNGTSYIYYDHGIAPPDTFSSSTEHVYMRIFSLLANFTIRGADGAISVSSYLQRELLKSTGLHSEVVYNSIDTKRFFPRADDGQVRQKHNLDDAPLVLYVGRISPHKGLHLLLDAFDLVREELPKAKLLVVGKHTFDDYSRKLRQRANGSVIFAGEVEDEELPHYYAACDVYATASLWEGFNLPLVEAQACGKPVVAFDIGAHAEVLQKGGTWELVPQGNVHALAKAMTGLMSTRTSRESGNESH